MKLCLSIACYRWLLDAHRRRDALAYTRLGWPLPYLQTVAPLPTGVSRWDWTIDKVVALGLEGFYVHASEFRDRATAEAFRERMAARQLTYVGGLTAHVAASEEEWQAKWLPWGAEQLQLNAWAGARVATLTHFEAARYNHFTTDLPVDEQLRRAARNLKTLVPVAAEHGIVMAFENHMDYRLSEVVRVVAEVDSPWLRITLDTANPFLVLEDPLEGARLAAPYVMAAHTKDFRLQPLTETWEPQSFWAPVGQGDAPIREILALLQAQAPDPAGLPACIEIAPVPWLDPDVWVRGSAQWLRTACGAYFPHQRA